MKQRDKAKRPIVVVRKKAAHGGHHGGSWKVAYADFVTAMMAFFMVMWIMGMDTNVKDMVQGYFTNPVGFKKAYSAGDNPLSSGNSPSNLDVRRVALLARDAQRARFEQAKLHLEQKLQSTPSLKSLARQVEIVVTDEGLRIELSETAGGATFFSSGSAELSAHARTLLLLIGAELQTLPNHVILEGHTDSAPYGSGPFSNWELSVNRANTARRLLIGAGVPEPRIAGVRGYADRALRHPSDPLAPGNRRITVLLPFQEAPAPLGQFVPGSAIRPAARQTPSRTSDPEPRGFWASLRARITPADETTHDDAAMD